MSIAETVDDYELAFDVFSNGRHCAAADIVEKADSKVWGALYEIPLYLIGRDTAKARNRSKSLDAIEGEGTNYQRREISVRKPNGVIVTALTYTVITPRNDITTNLDYVRCIILGLRERGISEAYIDKVKAIASANNPDLAHSLAMDTLRQNVAAALEDFRKVAALAGAAFIAGSIETEFLPKPHKPAGLPTGKMAVYAFFLNGQALKVGKAGANSDARYRSQHYNAKSAGSNLALSILTNPARIEATGIDEFNAGDWIKQNTDRVNLLVSESLGDPMLSLLESFLHVRWKPVFEGRSGDD